MKRQVGIALLGTALLVVVSVQPALADASPDPTDIATTVQNASQQADPSFDPNTLTSTSTAYVEPETGVSVPKSADADISVGASTTALAFSLPDQVETHTGQVAQDGSVNYSGSGGSPSVNVAVDDTSLRQAVVIPGRFCGPRVHLPRRQPTHIERER